MNIASGQLGKKYEDGEVIIRQGEIGTEMYVIQEGQVEVILGEDGNEVFLGLLGPGEFVGEMAIFDREVRSATVRARGPARVMTIDKRNFLERIHRDPSMAFRLVEIMSKRIRDVEDKLKRLSEQVDTLASPR